MFKMIKITAGAVALAVSACAAFVAWCWYSYNAPLPAIGDSRGPNAIWIRHDWVGERHTNAEYSALCESLRKNRMTDVFAHSGPLDEKGLVSVGKIRYAHRFLRAMRRECPEVRVQAWLGQIEKSTGGPLDISDVAVRSNIVKTAASMLDLGFGGVHYDIETIRNGDPNFIALLFATSRETKSRGKILSVSTMQLEPVPFANLAVAHFSKNAAMWDKRYFREAGAFADQFAIMMYDTQMPTEWMYGKLVERQTAEIIKTFDGTKTVFMGVPTYEDNRRKVDYDSEHIHSALRGIRHGLAGNEDARAKNFGVAIYAEWTTTPDEWDAYSRDWLNRAEQVSALTR